MDRSVMKITSESGLSFDAYVSTQGNPRPGLIICSEAFGVNSHMRSVADRFASHGYLAVVPDLLWRIEPGIKITYKLRRAGEIAEIFDKDIGAEDVQRTVDQVCQRGDFNG